jgi:hypothetical protein
VPRVFLGPPSYIGSAPGVARLASLSKTRARVHFREWTYLDRTHKLETIDLLALPSGRFSLGDGSIWELGDLRLQGSGVFKRRAFAEPFPARPYLFLALQTRKEDTPVSLRARGLTASAFGAALFEEEALDDGHLEERVSYLAIYSPTGSGQVRIGGTSYDYDLKDLQVGSTWTQVEPGYELLLQEERSADAEQDHPNESVHVLTLGGHRFAQIVSARNADTVALRHRTPGPACPSAVGDWTLHFDWGCTGTSGSTPLRLLPDGTFVSDQGVTGTWTQEGCGYDHHYPNGTHYWGLMEPAGDRMAGEMRDANGSPGCWTMER